LSPDFIKEIICMVLFITIIRSPKTTLKTAMISWVRFTVYLTPIALMNTIEKGNKINMVISDAQKVYLLLKIDNVISFLFMYR